MQFNYFSYQDILNCSTDSVDVPGWIIWDQLNYKWKRVEELHQQTFIKLFGRHQPLCKAFVDIFLTNDQRCPVTFLMFQATQPFFFPPQGLHSNEKYGVT